MPGSPRRSPPSWPRIVGFALVVFAAAAGGALAPARRKPLPAASPELAPEVTEAVTVVKAHCSVREIRDRPLARVGCVVRIALARLRKHLVKLIVLLSLGFSPVPFIMSFI